MQKSVWIRYIALHTLRCLKGYRTLNSPPPSTVIRILNKLQKGEQRTHLVGNFIRPFARVRVPCRGPWRHPGRRSLCVCSVSVSFIFEKNRKSSRWLLISHCPYASLYNVFHKDFLSSAFALTVT